MDSDLLSSCGLQGEEEIYSQGEYSLTRVDYMGRKLVAEISAASGIFQHRWPSVRGLVTPVSARDLPGGKRLLLFDVGEYRFLCEIIGLIKGFSEERALKVCSKVLRIATDLQSAGMICGYLGPEMFLVSGDDLKLLAGRRGVPMSPFTPPEVGRARPSDPRSDVSTIGSLLFRLIAGTDSREDQLKIWEKLTPPMQHAIQDMVAADPVDRPSSLKAVRDIISGLLSRDKTEPTEIDETDQMSVSTKDSFVKKSESKPPSTSNRKYWYYGIPLVLILAYLVFRFSGPPAGQQHDPLNTVTTDSVEFVDETAEDSPWAQDTVATVNQDTMLTANPLEDTARLWVSNCTGIPGLETDFRAGPARNYSFVYPLTGTTSRRTSVVLVRREDPFLSLDESQLGQAAQLLADSSYSILPVDLTIMLGTDLSFAGINSQFLQTPVSPSCTVYVDVVNHGIQYSLDGLGAATWTARALEGKSFILADTEYLIQVSDIRDADEYNEEIGIPEILGTTLFIYSQANYQASELELLIRQYLQAIPSQPAQLPDGFLPPDIHVLIGSPSD